MRVLAVILAIALSGAPGAALADAYVNEEGDVCLDPQAAERAVKALETRPKLEAALDTWEAVDRIRREQVRTATTTTRDLLDVQKVLVEEQKQSFLEEPILWLGIGIVLGGAAVAAGAWATR